ncbi:MAG: hypothetical protein IJL17_08340 [Kiritimatiellae bacterium]|nr:hypothetical protein [Kiritimatiellia bacterium]
MKHMTVFLTLAVAGLLGAVGAEAIQARSAPGRSGVSPLRPQQRRPVLPGGRMTIDPRAVAELLPLALEAADIFERATAREAKHAAELRRRGIAEVPPERGARHTVNTAGLGKLVFDDRGEIYIDRRFVTDEEMKTVYAIERWIAKWFPDKTKKRKIPRAKAGGAGLPVFRGFESARYQRHDALIARLTAEFNANKAAWCGGSPAQAAKIPSLSPAQVKAHMIEESGGNGPRSKAAWATDPLQVNVPGDWGEEKKLLGLNKPAKRNEGTAEANVRAAIKYLSRKGFGVSGRPAATRPDGTFDGWREACRRYNGRRDRTDSDRYYSDEYADKIQRRAANPDLFVPVEIKLAAPKEPQSQPAVAPQKPSDPA